MILAYDFGTGGIKAALFDEAGRCVRDAVSTYPTLYPAEGFHEQRPEDWYRAVVESTRALGDVSRVTAIGISGHSLGTVPIDAAGNLLRDSVPIWSDSRAGAEAAAAGTDDAWYMKTGCGFPAGLYPAFKLLWFRSRERAWFDRAAVVLGTKDWINFRLTGARCTDGSYASGSGVYDLARRRYDNDAIARLGLPRALFPEIVPSAQVIGTVLPDVARELGLSSGVKVVAGGVDNSCMALGAGAYREGRSYCSLGSSAWIAVSSARPVLDPRTRPYVFDHVVPGQYASALAVFSAGTSYTWLGDMLGADCRTMDGWAETAPIGANGLLFNASLAGGCSLDVTPAQRGAFVGLDLRHTRGDLARATMEGVAFGLRAALDELRRMAPVAEPMTLVGGGASSPLWRRIYTDVYGLRTVAGGIGRQCAALGAAALAGVGTGVWNGFDIVENTPAGETIETVPDPAAVAAYDALYARYRDVTRRLGEWTAENERKDA